MKNMKKKTILMLATMVLLLTVTVGSTIAYLVTSSGPVENKFTPAYVTSEVIEEGWNDGDSEKKDVTIKNTGNTSAYIRAAIVITWKDKDNHTMPIVPEVNVDYTIDINTTDWTLSGDYYYYKAAVAPDDTTTNLINSCVSTGKYTDGRKLCVEVIGSAIQSEGMDATRAQDAFNKAASGK